MNAVFEDKLTYFQYSFLRRADIADQLASLGDTIDSLILSTTALDALAKIWLHDFPDIDNKLRHQYNGGVSEAIRLSQLLRNFAKKDPDANKVAVVCFAEDWKLYHPENSDLADQLLRKRLSNSSNEFLRARELPKSYLDVTMDLLEEECPQIAQNSKLRRIAEEYTYGAMLYKFYRCPLVHTSKHSDRTHGFARGERSMYYWSNMEDNRVAISFTPLLITRWLRTVVTNYVQFCQDKSVIPARALNSGTLPENNLKKLWGKL